MLSKYQVLTLNQISAKGLALLPPEHYEVGTHFEDPDAILVRSADLHNRGLNPRLKAIVRAGAGVNNIPIDVCSQKGIGVFNTPGANANAVKELVLAAMLVGARNLCAAAEYVQKLSARAENLAEAVEQGKKQFVGFELKGKTLGVVGLGQIGVQVANAAVALGMRVIGFDPAISVHAAWQLNSQVEQAGALEQLLQQADIVTLHVPLLDATRHLMDSARLGLMKPQALLLNFSRGPIVDEQAVLEALNAEQLKLYIHDFPSALFKDHPKVISFPHLGASTVESEENCAVQAAENLRAFLELGSVRNSVNLPPVEADPIRNGCNRLAIVNDNDAGMIAAMTRVLGENGVNIEDMLNKSRGTLAYTLMDVSPPVEPSLLQRLMDVPGVRTVRVCH